MLILVRKIQQGIVIGDNILLKVLGVEGDRVKIGISAPPEISVMREELMDNPSQSVEHEANKPLTNEGNNSLGRRL